MVGDLLPCPFCGGSVKTMFHNGTTQVSCAATYAECAGSDVMAPIEMWNRRSDRAARNKALEEAAALADQWSEARLDEANAPIISGDVFADGGVFVQSTADAHAGHRLMDLATAIRALIAPAGEG